MVAPGITIKNRLRVLLPADDENYYDARDLIPSDLKGQLHQSQIIITNYHAFIPRDAKEIKGSRTPPASSCCTTKRAPSEEEVADKVQQEFDRPYGYFGSWKTTNSEIDVIEAEQTTVIGPTHLSADGPLLLSIKDAAKAFGISYSTLYQMLNQGDIEHVLIGSRKYLSREKLHEFIERNTHRGYYVAR